MIEVRPLSSGLRRLLIIGLGGGLFLWLRIEDNDAFLASAAGWSVSLLTGLLWLLREARRLHPRSAVTGGVLLGAVVGIGASLTTALLMLIKNGLHGHVFPDFPFSMIAGILERAPAWSLAGACFGLGAALVWISYRPSNHTES
ncbi:hypothetical protein FBR02_09250 [Anaerolineae bacterium CFX9]|nr:hypothetical protein [Anaerolineae bacterium CFX9]